MYHSWSLGEAIDEGPSQGRPYDGTGWYHGYQAALLGGQHSAARQTAHSAACEDTRSRSSLRVRKAGAAPSEEHVVPRMVARQNLFPQLSGSNRNSASPALCIAAPSYSTHKFL